MKNLNTLLELLLKNNIDFVLVGGYAGVVHGASQVTKDLDICCVFNSQNLQKLRDALVNVHPKHRMTVDHKLSFFDHPKETNGINNIYLETDLGVLDILGEVVGAGDYNSIKSRAIEISYLGHKCKVLAIEDLIKVKELMTRDKDKSLLVELRAILKRISKP